MVCKPDSGQAASARSPRGSQEVEGGAPQGLALLQRCKYRHIQAAVERRENGTRILVLPGIYKEEPSRRWPTTTATAPATSTRPRRPGTKNYEYQRDCPNAQNLIAIIGDGPDPRPPLRRQVQHPDRGHRRAAEDVRSSAAATGSAGREAERVPRRPRRRHPPAQLHGPVLGLQQRLRARDERLPVEDIVSRWSREYGFLSFTSDNGLYDQLKAYGSGDSGHLPGLRARRATASATASRSSHSESYGNTIGWSGTAGNGIYTHDSKFHHNAAGITMDSFAGGHPGMPQDCSKWENNEIYSNNHDLFNDEARRVLPEHARTRSATRKVCPTFQVPVGTGHPDRRRQRQHLPATTASTTTGARASCCSGCPAELPRRPTRPASRRRAEHHTTPRTTTSTCGNRMGCRPDGRRATRTASTSGGTRRARELLVQQPGHPRRQRLHERPAEAVPLSRRQPRPRLGTPTKSAKLIPVRHLGSAGRARIPPGCDWFTRPAEAEVVR